MDGSSKPPKLLWFEVPFTPKIIFIPRNTYIFSELNAEKVFLLVETAIFYGPPKVGLFSAPPSKLETGTSDVIPGLSPPFQAYLTRFYSLLASTRIRHILQRKNIYSVFITVSSQHCRLVIVVWHPARQKIMTDIDVADYDVEVEGSPNSSTQGSDQEAEEAFAGKTQTSISSFRNLLLTFSSMAILKIGI